MITARKKFRSQVPPSDRQLWAIGMVAVQWTHYENFITIIAEQLLENDPEALAQYRSTRNMKTRFKITEAQVAQCLIDPWKGRLLGIIRRSKDLQDQRDKIIHNLWSGPEDHVPGDAEAISVFNWGPPYTKFEWKLNYGQIVRVATNIDGAISDLQNFMVDASGRAHTFRWGDALKRISRIPDPAP